MNIWILNHYACTGDAGGGTRHFDAGRHLVRQGHDVTIIASSFRYMDFTETKCYEGTSAQVETIEGVRFVWLKTFPYFRNGWRRYVNMVDYMLTAMRHGCTPSSDRLGLPTPDVILGSSVHPLAVLAAYRLARRRRARFVMEVRDLWPQTLVDMGVMSNRSPVVVILRYLERFLYRKAERIIVLPPRASDYITALSVPAGKVVWIPNGVDLQWFDEMATRHPAEGRAGFAVMYTGALGTTNGVDILLRAARSVKEQPRGGDVRFVIYGDGPERHNLLRMKEEWRLENVEFAGRVEKTRIPAILRTANLLVHVERDIPNLAKYGSSPNKFYTYFAAGRPMLVCSTFVADRVDAVGCGVHLDSEDPDDMARAILAMRDCTAGAREEMGRKARIYVEQNYDMPMLAQRLLDALGGGEHAGKGTARRS